MSRWLFELRRKSPGKVIAIAMAVVAVPTVVIDLAGQKSVQAVSTAGQAGVDPDATRVRLRDISAALVTADKKVDVQLAQTVLVYTVAVKVTIANQPAEQQAALRNCTLAAEHLVIGAESVKAGGRWLNEDQFQAAAGDCRT